MKKLIIPQSFHHPWLAGSFHPSWYKMSWPQFFTSSIFLCWKTEMCLLWNELFSDYKTLATAKNCSISVQRSYEENTKQAVSDHIIQFWKMVYLILLYTQKVGLETTWGPFQPEFSYGPNMPNTGQHSHVPLCRSILGRRRLPLPDRQALSYLPWKNTTFHSLFTLIHRISGHNVVSLTHHYTLKATNLPQTSINSWTKNVLFSSTDTVNIKQHWKDPMKLHMLKWKKKKKQSGSK